MCRGVSNLCAGLSGREAWHASSGRYTRPSGSRAGSQTHGCSSPQRMSTQRQVPKMHSQGSFLLLLIMADMFLPSNRRILLQQAACRSASRLLSRGRWSGYRNVTVTLQPIHSCAGSFDARGFAVGIGTHGFAIGNVDSALHAETQQGRLSIIGGHAYHAQAGTQRMGTL